MEPRFHGFYKGKAALSKRSCGPVDPSARPTDEPLIISLGLMNGTMSPLSATYDVHYEEVARRDSLSGRKKKSPDRNVTANDSTGSEEFQRGIGHETDDHLSKHGQQSISESITTPQLEYT